MYNAAQSSQTAKEQFIWLFYAWAIIYYWYQSITVAFTLHCTTALGERIFIGHSTILEHQLLTIFNVQCCQERVTPSYVTTYKRRMCDCVVLAVRLSLQVLATQAVPELPDNLKASFRLVVMMVPHYFLIAEIMLFSVGFDAAYYPQNASPVFGAAICLRPLRLCIRAVNTVTKQAGILKRHDHDLSENILLVWALCDVLHFFLETYRYLNDLFPQLGKRKKKFPPTS